MKPCAMCGASSPDTEYRQSYTSGYEGHKKVEMLCISCYKDKRRIMAIINEHRQRARNAGLSDSLTLEQWLATLRDFNGKCAYCLTNPGTFLEHFVPVKRNGGGTTKSNCVPACGTCNRKKKNVHPSRVTTIPREDMERVYQYLLSQTSAY